MIRKKKIVVVDDDVNILKIIKLFLEKKGYSIVTVCKGLEAMITIEKERPHLVLLDITLDKNLSGEVIVHNIKEHKELCKTPIIMVTALANEKSKEKFISVLGCSDYVEKPFDSEDLLNKIKRVI